MLATIMSITLLPMFTVYFQDAWTNSLAIEHDASTLHCKACQPVPPTSHNLFAFDCVQRCYAIAHERAICHNLLTHSFTGERKKLDRTLVDKYLHMLCF